MANPDAAFGLKPIRHNSGAPYNGATRPYYVASTYAVNLFVGDPVVKVAGGSNAASVTVPGVGECPAGTLPDCQIGVASSPISGVIVSFAATDGALDKQYGPASTERVAFVADDPDLIFAIQEDSVSTDLAAADVGLNATIVTGSGSTATGQSAWELDSSSAAASVGLDVIIMGLHNVTGNAIGTNAVWEVKIANHTNAYVTGALGI